MKRVLLYSTIGLLVLACSDTTTGPAWGPDAQVSLGRAASPSSAAGASAVVEAVTGSGHLFSPGSNGWRTFTINAIKTEDGTVNGHFHWRLHHGKDGSKVSGSVICFSIEGNQAWLAVLFEKAAGAGNIGKWASIWVVDNGEGQRAAPDGLSIRWRGFPPDPWNPEEFCSEHWTDQNILPVESGNIQIH
jgi:hypothetical protein